MSETPKAYRLAKIASEINVGIDIILEHLKKKNVEIDGNPNAKVNEEVRQLLFRDFKSDIVLKERAEHIHLRSSRSDIEIAEEEKKVAPIPKIEVTELPTLDAEKEEPVADDKAKPDGKIEAVVAEPESEIGNKDTENELPVKSDFSGSDILSEPIKQEVLTVQESSEIHNSVQPAEKVSSDEQTEDDKGGIHTEVATIQKNELVQHDSVEASEGKAKSTEPKSIVVSPSVEDKNIPNQESEKKSSITTVEEVKKPKKELKTVVKEKGKVLEEETEKAKAKESKPKKQTPKAEKKALKEVEEDTNDYYEASKIVLSGPKVVGKINLDDINTKTRPEKKLVKREKKEVKGTRSDRKNADVKPKLETAESSEKRKRKRIVKKVSDRVEKVDPNSNKKDKERVVTKERTRSKVLVKKDSIIDSGEVSEKEIQDKIKSTMARLSGSSGSSGKNTRAKFRKQKRETAATKREAEEETDSKLLQVTEFITANELAQLMNLPVTTIITTCFSLGLVVSINQRLDAEVIELLAEEFGYDVEFANITEQDEEDETAIDSPEDLEPRPPIVTIMGHVDHGKTSLLDYIRTANVVAGEVGGITQHIGAYEVTTEDNKQITFLDTPGHEAFTAMRARGAKVTDIAVIVIAADDLVMSTTREAISHAQAAGVPMIFAINKIDKPDANPDKIREQLAQMNLLVEEWGGKYQCQEISAKKGLNIDLLLEKILFEAELLDLKANPNRNSVGTVIEASLDKGRGYVTTILVQTGTLHIGDIILAGQYFGKVKAMFNERGGRVKEAPPSTPIMVLGLNGAPQAGDKIKVMETEQEAKEIAYRRQQIYREQLQRTSKHITLEEIGRRLALGNFKELNLIVKGDVDGSVEALCGSLQRLSTEEIQIRIIHRGVGAITESDVLLASASDAIIIGFQVRPTINARKQAEQENIDIRMYSIIYNAINEIKSAMEGLLEPTVEERFVCNVEVRDVFKITKVGTVAGCYVTEGKINRDTKIRLIRDNIVVFSGEILSLKRFKDDVKEVIPGMECGISIKNFNDIRVGDVIEGYEEIQVKRTL